MNKPTNSTTVLPKVMGSAQYQACPEVPENTGTIVSNSTATTSWNSNTPIAFWPWGLKTSPRLVSSLLTMAVEDKARPAPSSTAPLACKPAMYKAPPKITLEMMTCRLPRPKTTLRKASIFDSENSRPRENRRNTTPSSAR
ncbi:hypothetical protein D3C85_937530 [compost metagenome]